MAEEETVGFESFGERYQLTREIGRGGFSVVYLGRDRSLGRDVAIKVLHSEFGEGVAGKRFLREIRLTAGLQHPCIVPLLDSGEHDGRMFIVMPYFPRGTLQGLLARERQLSMERAVAITRSIASALSFAHAEGVVHRDVKPANILFSEDGTLLADFGIARMFASSGDITSGGMVHGTPTYMSPEQAAGDSLVDGRSDLYSLACVLYEMLAGVPAFVGATTQSVISQRLAHTPQSVRIYRPAVPAAIDGVLLQALALAPADRFENLEAFDAALVDAVEHPERVSRAGAISTTTIDGAPSRRPWRIRGAIAAVLVAALLTWPVVSGLRRAPGPLAVVESTPDPLRFAVVPLADDHDAPPDDASLMAAERLALAMRHWKDVQLVSWAELGDSGGANAGSRARSLNGALRAAAGAGGARLITVTARPSALPGRIRASLWSEDGRELRTETAPVPDDSASASLVFGRLAVHLLRAVDVPDLDSSARETSSLLAWRNYTRGEWALKAWRLAPAEIAFTAANEADPQFARAAIWRGQVSWWRHHELPAPMVGSLTRVLGQRGAPRGRDGLLGLGLIQLNAENFPAACRTYRTLRARDSLDFAAWYGLGDCQLGDRVVIKDARSPSGWRFRSDFQTGIGYYLRALRLDPRGNAALPPERRLRVLFTATNRLVIGHPLSPDTGLFAAIPILAAGADSVVLVPYPFAEILGSRARTVSRAPAEAVDRLLAFHRSLLTRLALDWVAVDSSDADAYEALAFALELEGRLEHGVSGGLSAQAALDSARRRANHPDQALRLEVQHVRLLVKRSRFTEARTIADSVLAVAPVGGSADPDALASLAALTGRTALLAQWLARTPASFIDRSGVPEPVVEQGALLYAIAATGACAGFDRAIEGTERALDLYVAPSDRKATWTAVMSRPLSLGAPCDGGRHALAIPDALDRLVLMQQAYARQDVITVRAHLDTLIALRRMDRPGDVALDYTYEESWLLAQVGDTAAALARLTDMLGALPTLGVDLTDQVAQAGALCPAFSLASLLSKRRRELTASAAWDSSAATLCHVSEHEHS